MAASFSFDVWCTNFELKESTKNWLRVQGCDSFFALKSLGKEAIPIDPTTGVENRGEQCKILSGVEFLRTLAGMHIIFSHMYPHKSIYRVLC